MGADIELLEEPSNFRRLQGIAEGKSGPPPAARAVTDASGRFAVPVPRPGVWRVRVSAPGLVPMESAALAMIGPVELSPLTLTDDLGTRLRVVTAEGKPAAGVWVHARGRSGSPQGGEGWFPAARLGRTDAAGRLRLPRGREEALEVTAFSPKTGRGSARGVRGEATLLLPAAGAALHEVTVVDAAGEPLPGLWIAAGDPAWPVAKTSAPSGAPSDAPSSFRAPTPVPEPASQPLDLHIFAADGSRWLGSIPARGPKGKAPYRIVYPDLGQLAGRAVDGPSGKPLAGALVWPRHDPGTFVLTDAEGRFELALPPYERFTVYARAAGYGEFEVRLAGGREGLTFPLEPVRPAVGRVVDLNDRPVAGAEVRISPFGIHAGRQEPVVGVAGEDGVFQVPRLPAGRVDLEASGRGFATLRVRGVEVPAPTAEGGRSPVDLGTLVLEPGVSLAGRVRDPDGRPVADAEMRIRDAEEARGAAPGTAFRRLPVAARSDEQGAFRLEDLEPGRRLLLEVRHDDYLPTVLRDVEAPLEAPLAVLLEPAAGLRGRVVSEEGAPIAGAQVGVSAAPPATGRVEPRGRAVETSRTAVAGDDGTFRLEGLVPGELEIYADAEGFMPSAPERVALEPRQVLDGLTLVLRWGAVVEGRVVGPGGEPVGEARIRLASQRAVSDGEGSFRLVGVPTGAKTLIVDHHRFARWSREMILEPGENLVEVVLDPGLSVAGRVVDGAGEGIAGAQVVLAGQNWRDPRRFEALTDGDGGFELFGVVEGGYDLEARAAGFADFRREGALRVVDESLDDVEVVLEAGSTVHGRILGLEFEELMGAQVYAEDGEPGRSTAVRRGSVDHEGRFEVPDLAAGDWWVRASVAGGRRETSRRVVIRREGERIERDLVFDGVTLTGVVTYDGAPLPETSVTVVGKGIADRRSVVTDYQGAFEIRDLEPARYRLSASNPRELLNHSEEITLSGPKDVRIDLRSAAVAGRVVAKGSSNPVAEALVILTQLLSGGETGSMVSLVATAEGAWSVARLTPGLYRLEARKDSYAPAERLLEVRAGEDQRDLEIALEATEGVELLARLASGRFPESLLLNVLDAGGGQVFSELRVGVERGYARFPTVPAGRWALVISTPGGAAARIPATVPGPPVEVVLRDAGRLKVRVGALTESNLLATLRITDSQGSSFEAVDASGRLQHQWTVSGGTAVVDGIPAGTWVLQVVATDGQLWQSTAVTTGEPWAEVEM